MTGANQRLLMNSAERQPSIGASQLMNYASESGRSRIYITQTPQLCPYTKGVRTHFCLPSLPVVLKCAGRLTLFSLHSSPTRLQTMSSTDELDAVYLDVRDTTIEIFFLASFYGGCTGSSLPSRPLLTFL